jgi:hypothetical protein
MFLQLHALLGLIGLLCIGKTKSLRGRFSGDHKAFLWAWLDKYNDEDVLLDDTVIGGSRQRSPKEGEGISVGRV